MTTIIAFIIIFGVLVIVHEFGHFFFAKRSGILVREFSIGMGPKLFATQKNGTTYTLRLLPLGGYVRMAGWQNDDTEIKPGTTLTLQQDQNGLVTRINASDKAQLLNGVPVQVDQIDLVHALTIDGLINGDDDQRTQFKVAHDATILEEDGTEVRIAPEDVQFQNAPILKRLMVNFAGPMNNFILAILTFMIYGWVFGVSNVNTNQIGAIQAGSPAAAAGIRANAVIESVDGKSVTTFADMAKIVTAHPQKPLRFVVRQNERTQTLTVTPDKAGKIGVYTHAQQDFLTGFKYGFTQTWALFVGTLRVLDTIFTGHFSLNNLAGPVGIYTMTSSAAQQGLPGLMFFLGYLSLGLGITNLLPIPVLDGGKIVLNFLEMIRRKPLKPETEGVIMMIGVVLVGLLFIAVMINDIMRRF